MKTSLLTIGIKSLISFSVVGLTALSAQTANPISTDRLYVVGLAPQAPIDHVAVAAVTPDSTHESAVRPQGFEIVPEPEQTAVAVANVTNELRQDS